MHHSLYFNKLTREQRLQLVLSSIQPAIDIEDYETARELILDARLKLIPLMIFVIPIDRCKEISTQLDDQSDLIQEKSTNLQLTNRRG